MRRTVPALLAVGALAIIGAILILAIALPRQAAAPTLTPSPSVTPTPTASPTVAASPSPSPAPAGPASYASAGLGYSIEMPPPWHRSICSPRIVTQQGDVPVEELFVSVSARDETGTDIGRAHPTVRVIVEANPQNLTPRQWAEQGRSVGAIAGERIEDVFYADRPAARKSVPGTPLARYFVANGGRMYVVAPGESPATDAATQQTMVRIIESFRFLTDTELSTARAALPTPLPPRTSEQVADGVAAAFVAKDADALAGFLSACPATAGEQAGASFVSREKYVSDLRAAFAAGLIVTVRPRPFEGDRATGNLRIASTWQDSRGTRERKLMLRSGENDRWEWDGTIERLF